MRAALTDAQFAEIVSDAGYTGLPAGTQTQLLAMLKARGAYSKGGGATTAEQAAMVLRQNRVLSYLYPTSAEQQAAEEFLAAEGERVSSIESKFFEKLATRHSDLREAAKEERGQFLRAIIEHERGTDTAYYNSLSPALKAELNTLHAEMWGELTATERTALLNNAAAYEQVFNLRSGQELVASGIFEATEQAIVVAIQRGADAATRALLNDQGNRATLTRALIETVHVNNGQRGALSAEAQALLSAQPALAALVTSTANEMQTGQKDLLEREYVLINRFYDNFAETAEERREIGAILADPDLLNPDAKLSLEYEVAKEGAILGRTQAELTAALVNAIDDHTRYFASMQKEEERAAARANDLLKFAAFRGDDYGVSRFSKYRTYIGAERQYQQDNFTNIENNGGTLETVSLGQTDVETLFNGDWEAALTSDSNTIVKTVINDDGEEIEIRAVKSVSSATLRYVGNDAAGQAAEMRKTYFENLANNYLEATSQLNAALNAVFVGAKMADTRLATAREDIKQTVRDNYNTGATADQDLSVIQNLKIDAQSRLASHNETRINEYANGIVSALETQAEQAESYAGAGRRKQLSGMSQAAYLETRFNAVAAEMATAEANYNALSTNADTLRNEFAARNRDHADGLEHMAQTWREFEAANEEYEERAQVKEYAETPYLYASKADANDNANSDLLAEYRGDAKDEYDRALAALNAANVQLKQAGYNVQTQDDLEEFNAIVVAKQGGTVYAPLNATDATRLLELRNKKYNDYQTLDAAEETELLALNRREMYNRYAEVIDTQAEHIKQTMRMVRMHKASEIVNAEIMKLQAIADEKKQQFEQELQGTFGNFTADNQEEARNGVYLRLAGIVEGGGSFFDEFRGWYWKSTDWVSTAGDDFISSTASTPGGLMPTYTMNQIIEGAIGHSLGNNINATDRAMIGGWMKAGGALAEFGQFQGVYFGTLMAMGFRDQMYLKNEITKAIYIPIRANGMAINALPFAMGAGNGLINLANSKLVPAQMEYMISEIIMFYMYGKSRDTASSSSTQRVMAKQKEYEDALAKLYYFTRIPDLKTFKERLIKYGEENPDDPNDMSGAALYQILEQETENGQTVDDLIYLRDASQGYIRSDGSTYTPDAQTTSDTLDVTGELEDADYRDAFGRRYDPATLTASPPGVLEGGFYRAGADKYTRVKLSRPDKSTYYMYARIKDETAPKEKVYNMGEVLETIVDHGQQVRDRELAAYQTAGENAATAINDRTFLMNERDQTYSSLFNAAAGDVMGGREFTGYRMTYADYNANAAEVFDNELTQKQAVQQQEWTLREQELMDRYNSWEARVGTILERGRKSWAGTEDRFLAKMRAWNREFDEKEKAGTAEWDRKIKEHFTAKENWENETRQNASEETIERVLTEAVNNMNNQLLTAAHQLGIDIQTIDLLQAVNDAKADLANEMPSGLEKLKNINTSIKDFSTRLSIAELTGGEFLNAALASGAEFKSAMDEHQNRMKILTNVKIFEQYRAMARAFEDSIDDQNRAVDQQTEMSAVQAGFYRNGSIYVKQGSSEAKGGVHAYTWFDVRGALTAEKAKAGFNEMQGNELVSFLEGRNEVEVESYFYTQKLALQAAIERIQGRPNASGTNPDEIGLFNAWKGGTGNGTMRQALAAGARNETGALDQSTRDQAIEIQTAGFGELGARGQRPGGAPLGFYPELEWAGRIMAEQEANMMVMNPLAASLNQFNVLEAYEKVEVNSRVYGRDRGKLIEAQGASFSRGAMQVAGAALAVAGGPVGMVAGALLILAANSIEVDTESGHVQTRMNQQSVANTAVALLGSTMGPAGVVLGGVLGASLEYNDHGNVTHMDFANKEAATVAAGVSALGGNAITGAYVNRQLGVTKDYKQYNQIATTINPMEAWGGAVMGAAIATYGPQGQQSGTSFGENLALGVATSVLAPVNFAFNVGSNLFAAGAAAYGAVANALTTDPGGIEQQEADLANQNSQNRQAADNVRGFAIENDRRRFLTEGEQRTALNALYEMEYGPLSPGDEAALKSLLPANGADMSQEQFNRLAQSLGLDPRATNSPEFANRFAAHAQAGARYDANVRADQARQNAAGEAVWGQAAQAARDDYEGQLRQQLRGVTDPAERAQIQRQLENRYLSQQAIQGRVNRYETQNANRLDPSGIKMGDRMTVNVNGNALSGKVYYDRGQMYLKLDNGGVVGVNPENLDTRGNTIHNADAPMTQLGQAYRIERVNQAQAAAEREAAFRGAMANDISGSSFADVTAMDRASIANQHQFRVMDQYRDIFGEQVGWRSAGYSNGIEILRGIGEGLGIPGLGGVADFLHGIGDVVSNGIESRNWAEQSLYRNDYNQYRDLYSRPMGDFASKLTTSVVVAAGVPGLLRGAAGLASAAFADTRAALGRFFRPSGSASVNIANSAGNGLGIGQTANFRTIRNQMRNGATRDDLIRTGMGNYTGPDRGVAFFGPDNLAFYQGPNSTLGPPGGTFFAMPIEDSTKVKNAHDAAMHSGMSPSAQRAYLEGKEIYGVSFPTKGLQIRTPTSLDSRGWDHFLEGGQTAVRLDGPNPGYLVNETKEFVVLNGPQVPTGTIVFKLGPKGSWELIKRLK